MTSVEIRAVEQADVSALEDVIESTELFPREMLAPMLADYFAPPEEQDPDAPRPMWLALVDRTHSPSVVGVAYATYETLTDKTWNLLLIAVHKTAHGRGYGTQLIAKVEQVLHTKQRARMLLVETSGVDDYTDTRRFYEKRGYKAVATIPDFYEDGNDKVVYCKRLG